MIKEIDEITNLIATSNTKNERRKNFSEYYFYCIGNSLQVLQYQKYSNNYSNLLEREPMRLLKYK
jgi:hypothetical protein